MFFGVSVFSVCLLKELLPDLMTPQSGSLHQSSVPSQTPGLLTCLYRLFVSWVFSLLLRVDPPFPMPPPWPPFLGGVHRAAMVLRGSPSYVDVYTE